MSGGGGSASRMSESLRLTIVYERGNGGWVAASIPEVPGTHSQGQTREEARASVIDALRGLALAPSVWGSCGEVLHPNGPISAVLSGSTRSRR